MAKICPICSGKGYIPGGPYGSVKTVQCHGCGYAKETGDGVKPDKRKLKEYERQFP